MVSISFSCLTPLLLYYYAPTVGKGAISVVFVRLSVCLSVAYITNYSRTHRPSVLIFGRKFPHLRCDLHTSFKVKRSKVRLLVCNSLKYKLCILRIEEVSCSLAMIISAHEINKIASLMICVYVA